jgi:micrococcal nuclease
MYEYYTKIDKVVDGDTVDVFIDLGFSVWHKERIRLSGIDTAEKNTPLGKALKTYMASELEGKIIKLQVSKPDKYGRYLGRIYLTKDSTVSINDQLIKNGLAKSYDGDSKVGLWTESELSVTKIDIKLT